MPELLNVTFQRRPVLPNLWSRNEITQVRFYGYVLKVISRIFLDYYNVKWSRIRWVVYFFYNVASDFTYEFLAEGVSKHADGFLELLSNW